MFRWIFVSLLLSACGVVAVWMLVPHLTAQPSPSDPQLTASREKRPTSRPDAERPAPRPNAAASTSSAGARPEVVVYRHDQLQQMTEPIIIPDGHLVVSEKEVVPSEKDGVIKFIGTVVRDGEVVPKEKQLPDAKIGILAIPAGANDKPREGEIFFDHNGTTFRPVRDTDPLEPHKLALFQKTLKVRKLDEGDRVSRGQLLALINPAKQFDEVSSKVAKIDAADLERAAAEEQEREYLRRYNTQEDTNRRTPGAIPRDTLMETWIAYKKHKSEKEVKQQETVIAQRGVNAALTDLRMHEIRAAIDGVIKVIHKNHLGEAIKQHEPILEIQNPARLRVDARLEYQEALKLKEGMPVIVEASRPEAPRLVLSGHLAPVTCVAVSKGERPVIVSGSEDENLRGWDSVTGEKLWKVTGLRAAVRAVACTPPKSSHNLACFGCADGSVRVLNLEKPEETPLEMAERHRGPVLGVAFSPDGETIATCGDDSLLRLWKRDGTLLHILPGHSGPVTSVQFATEKRLVSAGKDNRLIVWDVEAGKPPHSIGPRFEKRGGEVLTLGVSPDGKTVLFDQGKELRVLTLDDRSIVGTLQNPSSNSMNFSTMALFSPDGKTILTNGAAPGKLQLWRTPNKQMRGSELRRFIWNTTNGFATCGAFAPEGSSFTVTGTQDHKVLVWAMPSQEEIDSRLEAQLTLVELNYDTQSRQVKVWAELDNPGWLIPGMQATMVVLPPAK